MTRTPACPAFPSVLPVEGLFMHHNFLFDLDQTLLDFHASEYRSLGIVMRARALPFTDEIYRFFSDCNKALWLELEKGNLTKQELFARRFRALLNSCGEAAAGLDPMEVNREFTRAMSVNGVVIDGAPELLENIRKHIPRARIYILTNGSPTSASARMHSTGIDRYVNGIFGSDALGVAKPSPEFFRICLAEIGEPRDTCIMIGDSLSSDMLGAKNACLDSVWFRPSGDVPKAMRDYDIQYCAASFDELYTVLERWASERDT